MSSAPTAKLPHPPHEPSALAAFLSYLIPGLGQIYQGRYGKGFLFMVSLLGMFMLGQAMGEWQNVYVPRVERRPNDNGERRPNEQGGQLRDLPTSLVNRWHYLGQFWIDIAAWPALFQYVGVIVPTEEASPFFHNFQKAPSETKLNLFLVNSDKTPDLGWVYTIVAGMLNILVIYDAYAGPLFVPTARPTSKDSPASKMETKKEGAA